MLKSASRLEHFKEYYFSHKMKEIGRMQASGIPVINLGIGSPDLAPPGRAVNAMIEEVKDPGKHAYQPYRGVPVLRDAVARWYQRQFGVVLNPDDEVLPVMGSKEGILQVTMAYLDPGDRVLVPDPGYPTYAAVARMMGGTVQTYILSEHNGYLPDLDQLAKTDLSGVKLMWVNYPHMPTGAKANRVFFNRLVEFGKNHEILVCNDNPYSFILNDDPLSILLSDEHRQHVLELNSLSKSHNMAGWRMGFILGGKALLDPVFVVNSNYHSGMFLPLQLATVAALDEGDEWYNTQNIQYRQRRVHAGRILELLGCRVDGDQAGLFLWAKLPPDEEDEVAFSDRLLEKAHVFIAPGSVFGEGGAGYLRISLCSSEEQLVEAFTRIENILK